MKTRRGKVVVSLLGLLFLTILFCLGSIPPPLNESAEEPSPLMPPLEIPVISDSENYLATYSDGSILIAAYRGRVELSKEEYAALLEEIQGQRAIQQWKAEQQAER